MMTSSSSFSEEEEESFFFKIKSEFHRLLFPADNDNKKSIILLRDISTPAAVFASKSKSQSALWIEKIKSLARNEVILLRRNNLHQPNSNNIVSAIIDQNIFFNFLNAIEFLSIVTFPFEQNVRASCNFNNVFTKKSSKSKSSSSSIQDDFKEIFVINYFFDTLNQHQQQFQSEFKKLISTASTLAVKKILEDSSKSTATSSSSTYIQCFGLLSGFRKMVVTKLRRELEKTLPQYSLTSKGSPLAEVVFEKMEMIRKVSGFLFPDDEKQKSSSNEVKYLEYEPSASTSSSSLLKKRYVIYGSLETVLIKTIKRVTVLGACDSVGDAEVAVVEKAICDHILRDKETGIDRAIILLHQQQDENNNIPWKMVQIAGEEAVANILSRRIQNHVAMDLEKRRVARNNNNNDRVLSIQSTLLPWLRFVLCDQCCLDSVLKQEQNTNNNTEKSSTPTICPYKLCCSNHTLIASAVREGMRAVFKMPRFEMFVLQSILNEIDQELLSSTTSTSNNLNLYRLLQALTTLPTHFHEDGTINTALFYEKKSWPIFFQHLAFQRILDQQQQQTCQVSSSSWISRELECARLLQILCDSDTQFYPRKYRGLINGFVAGQKLCDDLLVLTPHHFMPDFDEELIPASFKQNNTTNKFNFSLVTTNSSISSSSTSSSFLLSPFLFIPLQKIKESVSQTKFCWLPNEGFASASVRVFSPQNSSTIVVKGTPLQIAILYLIGNSESSQETILSQLFPSEVFVNNKNDDDSKNLLLLISSTLTILEKVKLISKNEGGKYTYVGEINNSTNRTNPPQLILPSSVLDSSLVPNSQTEVINRRSITKTFINQRVSFIAEEISNATKKRAGRPVVGANPQNNGKTATAENNTNTNATSDDLASLAERTRSKSAERGSETASNNNVNLISPIVIKSHALRLVKRAGKIKMNQWLEATRQLIKYNVAQSVFETVVDKLVEGEFVNKIGHGDEVVFEYLP